MPTVITPPDIISSDPHGSAPEVIILDAALKKKGATARTQLAPQGPYAFPAGEKYGWSVTDGTTTATNVLNNTALTHVDMVQAVASVNPGTTITQVNGFASYIDVNTPATNGGVFSVASLFAGCVTLNVAGASGWGFAIGINDKAGGSGAGRRLVGGEFDFSITHAETKVEGMVLTGISTVAPTQADGYVVGGLYGPYWQRAFVSADYAAVYALSVGLNPPSGGTTSVNSQAIGMQATDSGGVRRETRLYASYDGLHVVGEGARGYTVDNGSITLAAANTGLEIGSFYAAGQSFVDFHTSGQALDFDVRLGVVGGGGGIGRGTLQVSAYLTQLYGNLQFAQTGPVPSTPTSGFVMFVDADGKLKVKGSAGTVTTLAVP